MIQLTYVVIKTVVPRHGTYFNLIAISNRISTCALGRIQSLDLSTQPRQHFCWLYDIGTEDFIDLSVKIKSHLATQQCSNNSLTLNIRRQVV